MKKLTNKNIKRRHGAYCAECGEKLPQFQLVGVVNGKSVAFCSCKCCDEYQDKRLDKNNEEGVMHLTQSPDMGV